MTDNSELRQFLRQAALRDGTPVQIRSVRADDRERIASAFHKLDPQSVYTRFFGFKKDLTQAELDRLTGGDLDHFMALVVTLGSGADEIVIAAASCVLIDASGTSAELAFTVEEDYQGQGLAGKLLAALAEIALNRGIRRLEADVLALNKPMLAVFARSGLPIERSAAGGVVHLMMDLRPDPSATPPARQP